MKIIIDVHESMLMGSRTNFVMFHCTQIQDGYKAVPQFQVSVSKDASREVWKQTTYFHNLDFISRSYSVKDCDIIDDTS